MAEAFSKTDSIDLSLHPRPGFSSMPSVLPLVEPLVLQAALPLEGLSAGPLAVLSAGPQEVWASVIQSQRELPKTSLCLHAHT